MTDNRTRRIARNTLMLYIRMFALLLVGLYTSRVVLEALGEELTGSDEGNMNKVKEITGAPVPAGLAGIFSRPVLHNDVIEASDMKDYVIEKSKRG